MVWLKFVYTAAVAVAVAIVLWRGRAVERWSLAVFFAASIASAVVPRSLFARPELGVFAVDLAVFLYLAVLAFRADRFWPIWAAAFQLVGLAVHVARMLDPNIWRFAYAISQGLFAYPVLAALVLGAWFETGRERRA